MYASLENALERIRVMLEPYGEDSRLFVENRRDLYLSGGADGPAERREARHAGAALQFGRGQQIRARAWSGLDPQRLVDQVKSTIAGENHINSNGSFWVDGDQTKNEHWPWPVELSQSRSSAMDGGALSVHRTEQQVWVVRGGRVSSDRRTGERRRFVIGQQTYDSCRDFEGNPSDWPEPFENPVDRADPGEWVVVYAPGVAGVLVHELVGHCLEDVTARRYLSGLPKCHVPFSVVDDPRRGREPWQIDDDGVPAQAITLVDRGRITSTMRSLDSALKTGQAPTGHGRRSGFREPILARMGCTYLNNGEADPAAILADVKDGLWIDSIEAGTIDRVHRKATFRVSRARRIRSGRCAEPLLPFRLRCNVETWWRSLEAVGTDLAFDRVIGSCYRLGQPLAVSVGAPTCRQGVVTVVR